MPIENPWHSRPIDVHRWSEHPEAIRLAQELWEEYFSDFSAGLTGPKPKTSFQKQFTVVLLDLWMAWREDPELSIGVPLSVNAWNTSSRYNAIHISKKVIPIIHVLRDAGLVEFSHGSYGGPKSPSNRNSRIRASEKLISYFERCAIPANAVTRHPDQECIIFKGGDDPRNDARPIEYEDTPESLEMRRRLKAYNALLDRTFIDIPYLEHAYVERPIERGEREGETERVWTDPRRTFVRRIFSRGSWNANGRFYGGWWQQVNRKTRSHIFLNDVPTIEVDFKGLHVAILTHEAGERLVDDPYRLPEGTVPGIPPEAQRALVKQLVLTCINARSRPSAFAAFRDGWSSNHFGRGMTNKALEALLDAFIRKHPWLEERICSDQGIRLMNLDAQIAARLINVYTAANIPILCVHDSFIVPYDQTGRLRSAMKNASRGVVGVGLEVDSKEAGLDEMKKTAPHQIVLDFIQWREPPRCSGYLHRLSQHEEKVGKTVEEVRQEYWVGEGQSGQRGASLPFSSITNT